MTSFSIHAHFYQPPREDPFSGEIPVEPSAAPYLNWNERIYAECYRPNAGLGNFERISFNIGPTLFSWINRNYSDTIAQIVAQDAANVRRYGAGNALAQPYNHTILPLGGQPDKATQVYWGVADFEYHFHRKPQGIWLPETAVDLETLDVLARMGLQFTILAPWQAEGGNADPSEPYYVELPHGRKMIVFFYHGGLSGKISFDPDATTNADRFALNSLYNNFNWEKIRRGEPQLMIIASDGELYGHHQSLRDRFLARLVDGAASSNGMQVTYPALWLRDHAVRQTIRIRENTSWSCHHGVGRWTGECPCTPHNPEWKQRLRHAMDELAARIDAVYLDETRGLFRDPWRLRARSIHMHHGQMTLLQLLAEETDKTISAELLRRIGLLLHAQYDRQRMFTSCGWFFDDFDRIEPRNNTAYAAHACSQVAQATGVDLASEMLPALRQVVSPRTGLTAARVFETALARS